MLTSKSLIKTVYSASPEIIIKSVVADPSSHLQLLDRVGAGDATRVGSELLVVVSRESLDLAGLVNDGEGSEAVARAELAAPVGGGDIVAALLGALVDGLRSGSVAVALGDESAVNGLDVVVNSPLPGAGVVALVAAALGGLERPLGVGSHGLDTGGGSGRGSGGREEDGGDGLGDLHFGGFL